MRSLKCNEPHGKTRDQCRAVRGLAFVPYSGNGSRWKQPPGFFGAFNAQTLGEILKKVQAHHKYTNIGEMTKNACRPMGISLRWIYSYLRLSAHRSVGDRVEGGAGGRRTERGAVVGGQGARDGLSRGSDFDGPLWWYSADAFWCGWSQQHSEMLGILQWISRNTAT